VDAPRNGVYVISAWSVRRTGWVPVVRDIMEGIFVADDVPACSENSLLSVSQLPLSGICV